MGKKAAVDVVMSDAPSEVFSIPIMETVKAAQLQNGLRHRDFQRYRQYCSRRLARIRKSVKFSHGKGKLFINKKVDAETATEVRHLYLPLYNAERAWSYAMQLKEDDNLEKTEHGDDANTRIKFHLTGRLRKAAEWSQRLVTLCAAKADARTSLEAEAYAAFMSGNLAFHREDHAVALDQFGTARRIFTDLGNVGSQSQRELFQSLVRDLAPFMRFSTHRLQLTGQLPAGALAGDDSDATNNWTTSGDSASNALLQSKIDSVLLEARKQKVTDAAVVTWKQQSLAIPTQELALALLRPTEMAAQLDAAVTDASDKQFVALLSAFDTALTLLKSQLKTLEQQAKSGVALVRADVDTMLALDEYVRFQKLQHQVARSVVVYKQWQTVRSTAAAGDGIHLLDMIRQSVQSILQLPALRESEPLVFAKYSAYDAVVRATRAATIAQAMVEFETNGFADALTLFQSATTSLDEAIETLRVFPAAKDDVLQTFVDELTVELAGATSRTTALAFLAQTNARDSVQTQFAALQLEKGKGKKATPSSKSLLDRQHAYSGGSRANDFALVQLPPDLFAIACKPMLFDVAFNALEFPDLSDRMKTAEEKRVEAEAKAAADAKAAGGSGGGLFGWFRK